jgi:hypothetical protein
MKDPRFCEPRPMFGIVLWLLVVGALVFGLLVYIGAGLVVNGG